MSKRIRKINKEFQWDEILNISPEGNLLAMRKLFIVRNMSE
ncbi:hypothetical protein [Desulfitobacterium metallireducens]|uniref:Uncharacterized protein n=1 Tax=Desulfitobacterium metallireducens DSM 15288 TaxID=871968 RepID=W0EHK4_9FIRM|nr:hypothetical protein [Desulfitobacterium metallireducens]AHF08669.1 hypothetical protein DESME_13695 [Desulfitobacterium metallireducens DSM 15288]